MGNRQRDTPVSNRVRAAMTGDDPELVAQVKELERLAYVAENGKWQRWLAMLTVIWMIVAAVGGGLAWTLWLGGTYRDWNQAINTIPVLSQQLNRQGEEQQSIRQAMVEIQRDHQELHVDERPRLRAAPSARPEPRAAFPRDERFIAAEPQR